MGTGLANGTNEELMQAFVKFLFWKKTIIRGDLIELYKLLTRKDRREETIASKCFQTTSNREDLRGYRKKKLIVSRCR